jgi:magnesium transporter
MSKSKKRSRHSSKAGLPPGTLIHIGKERTEEITIELLDYDADQASKKEIKDVEELRNCLNTDSVSWVNVNGVHDAELVASIGKIYGIHDLVLEDVLNTEHHPKVEPFDDYVFFTMKMISYNDKMVLEKEQLSIVFSKSFVLCFQEKKGDVFDPLRERILKSSGIVRKKGNDYLVYRLIDTVVDNYFFIVEEIEEKLEVLEEAIIANTDVDHTLEIQRLKREMLVLKKALLPLRDAVSSLEKGFSDIIETENDKYFHDVYDHLVQIQESLESNREVLSSLMDLQMANMSNRMNQVMKVLTVIATIFIPLTFIAGIYGMNFDYMPELHYKNGYFVVWGVMLAVFMAMLIFFRRKKWF